jgi:hypothetical protein
MVQIVGVAEENVTGSPALVLAERVGVAPMGWVAIGAKVIDWATGFGRTALDAAEETLVSVVGTVVPVFAVTVKV